MRALTRGRRLTNSLGLGVALTLCTVGVQVMAGTVTAPAAADIASWTGTISTSWHTKYSIEPDGPSPDHYTYDGNATFTNLQLDNSATHYTADATITGTYKDHLTTPTTTCTTLHTVALNGNTGDLPAIAIDDSDGQVWMAPQQLLPEGPYELKCADGYTTSGFQAVIMGAFTPGLTYSAQVTADTDPAPGRLVGTMSWSYPNLPADLEPGSITEYSYTLTYDLTRTMSDTDCEDGADNDGDGVSDLGDPGCESADDTSELSTLECDNGRDDDGDGDADHRANGSGDPDCTSLTDDTELGDCDPTDGKDVTYQTITAIPASPDAHWYTTSVSADACALANGDKRVTGLSVNRHVENGPLPRLIGLFGWRSKTETEVDFRPGNATTDTRRLGETESTRFDPPQSSVSARLTYTACWDVLKLLDKAGVKSVLKKKMKKPLRKGIKSVLKKAGINKINKKVRKKAVTKFSDQVDHAFKKGTIKTVLRDRFKVPEKIGGLAEQMVAKQESKIKRVMKGEVKDSMSTGKYDGLTASLASDRMINDAFKHLDRLTSFCGGTTASSSWFLLLDTEVHVTGGTGIEFARTDHYTHPLMTNR